LAKLTDEQAKQLEELEKLRDAPDEPAAPGRSEILNYTIDLGDEAAVERGLRLGLLQPSDLEGDDDDGGDDDDKDKGKDKDKDKPPSRRGYFKEG
jgi:hypothetical protein